MCKRRYRNPTVSVGVGMTTEGICFIDGMRAIIYCVVAKRLDDEGYIVTVYVTDSIKEGEHVWPTSG